jgi:ferritin-like metal-binding protein YciE
MILPPPKAGNFIFILMAKSAPTKKAASKPAAATSTATSPTESGTAPAFLDFFKDELRDIYWAENHLIKALPKMQDAATSEVLANAISTHLEQTRGHVARLEQVFQLLGEAPKARKCDAMEGLAKEGEGCIETTEAGTATRDVAIIMSSQKVEHYEIATYGGLIQLANTIGLADVADILAETLAEEKETDELLTDIAENSINYEASAE